MVIYLYFVYSNDVSYYFLTIDPTSDVPPVNDTFAQSEIPNDSHHLLEEEMETKSEVALLTEQEAESVDVTSTSGTSENLISAPTVPEDAFHQEDHGACVASVPTEESVETEITFAEKNQLSQEQVQEVQEENEIRISDKKNVETLEGELVEVKLENLSSELIDLSPPEPSIKQ
jgi:hypothetical protein